MVGNKWWDLLNSKVKSFAADYSRQFNLIKLAAQTACEAKVDRAIKSPDNG